MDDTATVDTQDAEFSSSPPDASSFTRQRRQPLLSRSSRIILLVAAVVTLVIQSFAIHVPFMELSPGEAFSADDVILVDGRVDADAELYVLTVAAQQLTAAEFVGALFQPERDVVPLPPDMDEDGRSDALGSGVSASLAAYSLLGIFEPQLEVSVLQVFPDSPAAKAGVSPGRLRAINGEAVSSVVDAQQSIVSLPVGSSLSFDVVVEGTVETFEVVTSAHPSDPESSWAGVLLSQQLADLPPDLPLVVPTFGGPSAGLALALDTVDQLTPGDLAGGRKVAVTGAIDPDGTVRPVGGVRHKTALAEDVGAELLLVPVANFDEALASARHVEVVPVGSLEEALSALGWAPSELADLVGRSVLPDPPGSSSPIGDNSQ